MLMKIIKFLLQFYLILKGLCGYPFEIKVFFFTFNWNITLVTVDTTAAPALYIVGQ